MPTFRSISAYRAEWRKRYKSLRRAKDKSELTTAKLVQSTAKVLAPVYTGATVEGIRVRKSPSGYTVESWVPGIFKQNMWANRTPPFDRPTMRWNKHKPTLYGDGSHRTSGTPRFFDIAVNQHKKSFRRIVRENTSKALRGKVV